MTPSCLLPPDFRATTVVALELSVLLFLLCGSAPAWAAPRDIKDQHRRPNDDSLVWQARAPLPAAVGRHHPITFANATHGFVLSGSTAEHSFTSDFWSYEATTDRWTDLTHTAAAFPGSARSFGYAVYSSSACSNHNNKAYVGFGAGETKGMLLVLNDWWEFDTSKQTWRRLADLPASGRRHPAMNYIESLEEIHVGLGDGAYGNYNDYWSYHIETNEWRQLENFPSRPRHHPFYFAIGTDSYVGMGHSDGNDPFIERDWYRYDALGGVWYREKDFASYNSSSSTTLPVTTEGRVAGTQFTITTQPPPSPLGGSCNNNNNYNNTLGFVLSGDGDDHWTMETGEFHVFDHHGTIVVDDDNNNNNSSVWWSLPPHPGVSRWAPGSFVLQGSTRVYFLGGYDHEQQRLLDDLWTMDLKPLLDRMSAADDEIDADASEQKNIFCCV